MAWSAMGWFTGGPISSPEFALHQAMQKETRAQAASIARVRFAKSAEQIKASRARRKEKHLEDSGNSGSVPALDLSGLSSSASSMESLPSAPLVSARAGCARLHIEVYQSSGEVWHIDQKQASTVADLKRILTDAPFSIPYACQSLVHGQTILRDGAHLRDHREEDSNRIILSVITSIDARVLRDIARNGTPANSSVVAAVLPFLEDEDFRTRHSAVQSLAVIANKGDVDIIAVLSQLLEDDHRMVREATVKTIDRLGGRCMAIDTALKMLKRDDWPVRLAAVETLASTTEAGDARVLGELINCLADENINVKEAAELAVYTLGGKGNVTVVTATLKRLKSGDWDIRMNAVEALAIIAKQNDEPVVAAIIARLEDEHQCVREAAAKVTETLGVRGNAPAIVDAIKRLSSDDWFVRQLAVEALAALAHPGDRLALPAVIARLEDPHPRVRTAAANAVDAIGSISQGNASIIAESINRLKRPYAFVEECGMESWFAASWLGVVPMTPRWTLGYRA